MKKVYYDVQEELDDIPSRLDAIEEQLKCARLDRGDDRALLVRIKNAVDRLEKLSDIDSRLNGIRLRDQRIEAKLDELLAGSSHDK